MERKLSCYRGEQRTHVRAEFIFISQNGIIFTAAPFIITSTHKLRNKDTDTNEYMLLMRFCKSDSVSRAPTCVSKSKYTYKSTQHAPARE